MTPRTPLGRVLLTGGNHRPVPRDACRTPEDVDATLALLPALSDAEREDAMNIKRQLGAAGRSRK